MSYADICKARCELCAKGVPRVGFGLQWHGIHGTLLANWPRCTAPTPEQVIEEQCRLRDKLIADANANYNAEVATGREKDRVIAELQAAVHEALAVLGRVGNGFGSEPHPTPSGLHVAIRILSAIDAARSAAPSAA